MALSVGTVLTKKKSKLNQLEEVHYADKENQIKVSKSPANFDSNLEALRQHQKAKLAEIQRQQEKILAITSNRAVAEHRGIRAEQVLKQKQYSNAIDSQKILKARMEALKVERERAGFIASLPPPSKDSPPTLLDKFNQNPNDEKRRFFKSIRETASQQSDARIEALIAQDQEVQSKEMKRKQIEEIDVKSSERFSQALKKEQLKNCHKEVMDDLEKAYRADRMKQQQRIVKESLANFEKKTVPKVIEIDEFQDKTLEEASEKAVRELGIDLDLGFAEDMSKNFVTQRRRKKKGNSLLNDTTLDFQSGFDWVVSPKQRDHLDGLYLNDDISIQNGMNVSLYADKPNKDHQINSWNDLKTGKPVVTTATQTVESNLPAQDKSSLDSGSTSQSFLSLPQELNISNNPLSSSMLQKYEQHLILQAKRGKFFTSPKLSSKYVSKSKSSESTPIPFTPNEAFSSSTTIGLSTTNSTLKSAENSPDKVGSASSSTIGSSSTPQSLPIDINSPTTIGSSSIASSMPRTVAESENRDEASTTSSGSTKLSQQIKKVLEKCIGSDQLLTLNFQPKLPERFFKEIDHDKYEPIKKVKERTNQPAVRHRIFPEVKENVIPNTEPLYTQTRDKLTEGSTINVDKPLVTKTVSPNPTPNISHSVNECDSSQSSISSSNKSSSDAKTRTMQQAPNTDFRIPAYIQHKFLSEKFKNGSMDQPIETIDDLREILSLLPSGHSLEECLRSRPPVSYPQWVDEDNEPHELSTIAEVDTPYTSFNCSRELIFSNKPNENPISQSSCPEKQPTLLRKSDGFFSNCSLEDSLNHARLATKLETLNSQSSDKSNSKIGSQPRWEDLLKKNYKPKSTNFSPNLDEFNSQQVKCQSTPVKDAKTTCDEDDLMAVNITLIGPEITVSGVRGSMIGNPNHTGMSESLLSFLKHEEEANTNT